ncbi:SLBB domain-containing protein [Candidatus Cloacimonadota bacterium]
MRKIFLIVSILIIMQLSAQIDMQEVYYNVSVTGAVEFPGVYHLPPTSRLSEAIMISRGLSLDELNISKPETPELEETYKRDFAENSSENFLPEEEEEFQISLRNIKLKRKSEIILIDLQKFLILGDDNENPFLMDGDVIFVPALRSQVEIIGEVINPGEFEILENDRISDILEFSLGLKKSAYLDEAEIIRYDNNDRFSTKFLNLNNVLADPADPDNIILENGDRIYIRAIPQFQQYDEVTVFGEVNFPGTYVINENTTLSQILERVGSFTDDADPNNSFLQRRDLEEQYDAEFERLKYIPIMDMTYIEYEYFKTKSKELRGKFSLNLNEYYNSEVQGKEIVLHDGDFIYISSKINAVVVSGQVKEPGLVTFIPGKSAEYYIDQAGGLGWKARKGKIRIIRAKTGEWLKFDKDLILEEGDTIMVPYKPDWNLWEIFKDTVVVLSQIATLYLVIQSVK